MNKSIIMAPLPIPMAPMVPVPIPMAPISPVPICMAPVPIPMAPMVPVPSPMAPISPVPIPMALMVLVPIPMGLVKDIRSSNKTRCLILLSFFQITIFFQILEYSKNEFHSSNSFDRITERLPSLESQTMRLGSGWILTSLGNFIPMPNRYFRTT